MSSLIAPSPIGSTRWCLRRLFGLLDPLTSARYWVSQERWAEAEAAYKEARRTGSKERLASGSFQIECGRFFAAHGKPDDAAQSFLSASGAVPFTDLAKEILAWPAVRDLFFGPNRRYGFLNVGREMTYSWVLDAVFPKEPFAH